MAELRIFDDRPGKPRVRIHPSLLFRALLAVRPDLTDVPWTVEASWGTGPNVADLEDSIGTDHAHVVLGELLPKLEMADEFYDARFVQGDLAVGIFDSTWLFLRGPRELLDAVAARFERAEIVERPC
jgi:hypothetical protein